MLWQEDCCINCKDNLPWWPQLQVTPSHFVGKWWRDWHLNGKWNQETHQMWECCPSLPAWSHSWLLSLFYQTSTYSTYRMLVNGSVKNLLPSYQCQGITLMLPCIVNSACFIWKKPVGPNFGSLFSTRVRIIVSPFLCCCMLPSLSTCSLLPDWCL